MGRSVIKPKVIEYLEKRPGVTVYADDIADAVGTDKLHVQQVISAIKRSEYETDRKISANVEVTVPGNAWRWHPNRKNGRQLFEELTTTKAGTILVQSEDGTKVYKLVELVD
jgi:hypothetical protein